MPFTITHPFVSTIPDSPSAIAAGEVTPSRWNDSHLIAGAIQGNEVVNFPSGSVTATNVQAAINQLASLIPSPGPGTDPLVLTLGFQDNVTNPAFQNPDDRRGGSFAIFTDVKNMAPEFSNMAGVYAGLTSRNGQQNYNSLTQAKISYFTLSNFAEHYGAGQRFCYSNNLFAWGMGDCAIHGNDYVQYACGPTSGDEGQAWGTVSNLTQNNYLLRTTIFATFPPSGANTTTTQAITKSVNLQTVTVANATGIAVNDWIVIERMAPSGLSNTEAVKVVAVDTVGNTVTGVFRCNHNSGVTVTPALVMHLTNFGQFGQERVIINLTQPSYSAGQITAVTGGGLTGSGTVWTNNMVGGDAINVGAIAMTADDYTGSVIDNFTPANPCKSWYQIYNLTSNTSLGAFSFSTANDTALRTKGPGPTGSGTGPTNYIIRQCAKILMVDTDTNHNFTGIVVCETSTSTWTVGDTVECVMCPYPDVTGFQHTLTSYTNGAYNRAFHTIRNLGPRMFLTALTFDDPYNNAVLFGPTGDGLLWGTVINITAPCQVGLNINALCTKAAITLGAFATNDIGSRITWANGTYFIGSATVASTGYAALVLSVNSGVDQGSLKMGIQDISRDSTNAGGMLWGGYFAVPKVGIIQPSIWVDNITGTTNYERAYWRFLTNGNTGKAECKFGTDHSGTGVTREIVFEPGGVSTLRVDELTNVAVGGDRATNTALATNATSGFFYLPTCAGTPTGIPTNYPGRVALVYDTTNNKLYIYNSAWRGGTVPGAWS